MPLYLYFQKFLSIGKTTAKKWCTQLGYPPLTKNWEKTPEIVDLIHSQARILNDNYPNFIKKRIQQLINLKTIRGYKHRMGYPVNGQRTKTNAQTAKKMRWQK